MPTAPPTGQWRADGDRCVGSVGEGLVLVFYPTLAHYFCTHLYPQIAPRAFCTTKDWIFCIKLSVHDVHDCTRQWGWGLSAERSTKPPLGYGGRADSITMLIQEHLCQRPSCQNDFSETLLCKWCNCTRHYALTRPHQALWRSVILTSSSLQRHWDAKLPWPKGNGDAFGRSQAPWRCQALALQLALSPVSHGSAADCTGNDGEQWVNPIFCVPSNARSLTGRGDRQSWEHPSPLLPSSACVWRGSAGARKVLQPHRYRSGLSVPGSISPLCLGKSSRKHFRKRPTKPGAVCVFLSLK